MNMCIDVHCFCFGGHNQSQTEMVWKIGQRVDSEQGCKEFGSGRQEVEKTREEVYRCSEKRHKVNWCEIRGCRGELIGGR